MSIVVGTGKNARVRLNTGELQNGKDAEKKPKTETPAEGGDGTTKGKGGKSGGKSGGKGKGKEETPKTETPTTETETPAEGGDGNENQAEE